MNNARCKKCDHKIDLGDIFCVTCGTRVGINIVELANKLKEEALKEEGNLECEQCGGLILKDENSCTTCDSDLGEEISNPLEGLLGAASPSGEESGKTAKGTKLNKVVAILYEIVQGFLKFIQDFIKNFNIRQVQHKVKRFNKTLENYIFDFERFINLYDDLFGQDIYKPEEYIKGFGKYKRNAEDEVRQDGEKHPRAHTQRAMELFIMLWIRYELQGQELKPVTETERIKMTREFMLLAEQYPEGKLLYLRYSNGFTNFLDELVEWQKKYYFGTSGIPNEKDKEVFPIEKHHEINDDLVKKLASFWMAPEEFSQGKLYDDPNFNKSTIRESQSDQSPFEELMVKDYANSVEQGDSFEHFCGTLLTKMGYKVEKIEGGSNDRGIDIRVVTNDAIKTNIAVQCKHYPDSSKITTDVIHKAMSIKQLRNESFDKVIVMTSGLFTSEAIRLAEENNIGLFDYNEIKKLSDELLSDMNLQEIEKFGSSFRKI